MCDQLLQAQNNSNRLGRGNGVGVEWHFLGPNRWLYKEIHSRQDRPTSSLLEGVLSSSIDQGAYHVAFYRTYCFGISTEPAPRVSLGGLRFV
jgi:hypothetical protein